MWFPASISNITKVCMVIVNRLMAKPLIGISQAETEVYFEYGD
jgi:hypothetical protein